MQGSFAHLVIKRIQIFWIIHFDDFSRGIKASRSMRVFELIINCFDIIMPFFRQYHSFVENIDISQIKQPPIVT